MPIEHLTDDQIATWTREQKDRWWLEKVFRGNMPQLTLRAALTGFCLGGILSATNLYIGAKTGWTLGVGLTSVILAFATFKVMGKIGLAKEFTILENNAMQSVATAAGYMTGPLVSGLAAYMMVKNAIMPWWQMLLFNVILSILGVLVAFPMKRRFINDEQQPFPEGRACGVLLDTLYTSAASVGLFKAKALAGAAIFAGTIKFMMGEAYHTLLQSRVLGLEHVRFLSEHPVEKVMAWMHVRMPAIQNIDLRKLDLSPTINLEMFGAGGLMNIRYAINMLVGMIVTWAIVVPGIVDRGDTMNSKGKQFTPPATLAADGSVAFWGRTYAGVEAFTATVATDGEGEPLFARILVGADAITDASGRALKAPVKVKAGKLIAADGKAIPFENLTLEPGKEIEFVKHGRHALPVTIHAPQGEEMGGAPVLPLVQVTPKGLAYADGTPITPPVTVDAGSFTPVGAAEAITIRSNFNRGHLLNSWALWPGVAMLVCASMVSLFAKPKMFVQAFSGLMGRKKPAGTDVLAHIELPFSVSLIGVPLVGALGVWMAHEWFGVSWLWGALAIPLIAVLTIIAAQATALTSITPTGSLSKITQFTFGALDRKFPSAFDAAGKGIANPAVNLMTACMTTEVASNAANLLMDIKPGYMLGAKPRQQAVGHCIGIVSGALASTPLFYLLFLAGHPDNPFTKPKESLQGARVEDVLLAEPDKFSFVGAVQWKGISDLITGGLSRLPESALWAMGIAAAFGIIFEIWRMISKNKLPISPLAFGLGIVLPPDSTVWMFFGAFFFWAMGRVYAEKKHSLGHRLWIDTHEPICAGLVAGAALIGIGDILVKVFLLQ